MRLIVWIVDPDTATLLGMPWPVRGFFYSSIRRFPPVGRRIPIFSWQKYNLAVRQ